MNDLFLKALNCQNFSRPPVWFMRQAGRHLASYRAMRANYSFLEMCHNPDLISQVTLLPLIAYNVDAAILFSDILVIPEALGVGLRFEDNVGPIIERPISRIQDVYNLPSEVDTDKLQFVADGILQLKPQLKVPLIGFCGAPFTVASYMIEGKSSRDLKKTKFWMFNDPNGFHELLEKITTWSIAYLKLQIESGVNAIQIFDSWASSLAYNQFCEFSSYYLQRLMLALHDTKIPCILFCRGSSVFASQLATLEPAGISLDWNCNLKHIRKQVLYPIALQGNLDPDLLYAPSHILEREVNYLLDIMNDDQGFIFNLGHGIAPDVSEYAVQTVVNCVKRRV